MVHFAVQVGSPELLQMLYVLTAADLGAVGPGVWDGWKAEILTDLYHRTMQQLAGESPATTVRRPVRPAARGNSPLARPRGRRRLVRPPRRQLALRLPQRHRAAAGGRRPAAAPRHGPANVIATAQYLPETATVQFTIATSEEIAAGIFHKLTGALTSHGLEIRSAQIHTLADGLVLDRFWVHDPDFAGEPPQERLAEVNRSLIAVAAGFGAAGAVVPPHLAGGTTSPRPRGGPRTQVNTDNNTSEPLHDHRRVHPRPHRACSTPSPARCSSWSFPCGGRRSPRIWTRSSTFST